MKHASGRLLNVGISLTLACVFLLAGNTSTFARTTQAGMKTLRLYYMEGEVRWTHTLDSAYVTDVTSYNILNLNQADLVKLGPSGNVLPALAYRWVISKNRRVYWFYLRKGLRFSNGDPLTASDAAFSITRSLLKATSSPVGPTYLGHIVGAAALSDGKTNQLKGVKVLNPTTLEISLDSPIVFFLKTLTYPTADVLDPRVIRGHRPNTYMTDTCAANVGAGPFVFVCRNRSTDLTSFYPPGSTPTMTLVPNKYYYGAKPHIMIKIPVTATVDVDYRSFKAGQTDTTTIPTADIGRERGKPGYLQYPSSGVQYLTSDETSVPFDNVHCRLAVAYALDRATIDNKVLHGFQKPIYDIVPSFFLGYYAGNDSPHYNPARARAELRQCPGGIKNVQIAYSGAAGSDLDNEVAAISAMASAVGIDLKPKKLLANDYFNALSEPLSKTGTKIIVAGWGEDYPDPQDYCENLLASYSLYDNGGYHNKDYDSLMKQANVEPNQANRARMYIKAQRLALSQGAWITIGIQISYALINPRVHGLVGGPAYGFVVPKNDDWSNVTIS